MSTEAIFALITKGIAVAELLISAGKSAAPAFEALKPFINAGQAGEVTDAMLAKTEAILDAQMAEFNEPI